MSVPPDPIRFIRRRGTIRHGHHVRNRVAHAPPLDRHRPSGTHRHRPPLDTLQGASFVLAGIAFFVAIGLLLLDVRRPLLYLAGIPFTGVQVVLYFYLNWPNVLSPGGIGDKVVQVALIAILVILYRRESAAAASAAR